MPMVTRKRPNAIARKVLTVLVSNRPEGVSVVVRTPKVIEAPNVETPARPAE